MKESNRDLKPYSPGYNIHNVPYMGPSWTIEHVTELHSQLALSGGQVRTASSDIAVRQILGMP
jgi:hypothetical protein